MLDGFRSRQNLFWFERAVLDQLHDRLYATPTVAGLLPELRRRVAASDLHPDEAGELLIQSTGWFRV
jgi:hypothetical protein